MTQQQVIIFNRSAHQIPSSYINPSGNIKESANSSLRTHLFQTGAINAPVSTSRTESVIISCLGNFEGNHELLYQHYHTSMKMDKLLHLPLPRENVVLH